MTMRQLGVGLVYWPDLSPVVRDSSKTVSVLEVELQTFWEKTFIEGRCVYRINEEALREISMFPQTKLVHGVGHPVGGLTDDPLDWCTPFSRCVDILKPPWASEHLSFNRFTTLDGVSETSFFLPPRQTPAGVAVATDNLRRLQNIARVPVAFETGVNYLQRRSDEMSDGDYFAAVANAADCGILLDLHNLWANERNGRQPLVEVLNSLPLMRVWEIHLAGGMLLNGYWLDSHSGLVDDELMQIAEQTIARLPNIGSIVYEILPQYIGPIGLERIHRQLEDIAALWRRRPAVKVVVAPAPDFEVFKPFGMDIGDVVRWEETLAAISLGWSRPKTDPAGLAEDPGGAIFEQLVREFRSGRVVRVLRYSTLALFRHLGTQAVDSLVQSYCSTQPADIFTAVEAERFAAFLQAKIDDCSLRVPFLDEVLAFERAMVRASLYGSSTQLEWSVDPTALLEALETGCGTEVIAHTPVPMTVQVTRP
jgi:uncharacterized protein